MLYDFPVIENIDDVLKAIQGFDEFKVIEKENYTVVKYLVSFENTWDITDNYAFLRRECRGLIFDKEGNIIARPYQKFFNVNEREETKINKVNLYKPHVVLEKLDGSMVVPFPSEYGFRLATKAGITDVSMVAECYIADKIEYYNFIMDCIEKNLTPIFEWCSRKNRIVIDYPDDALILTAIRDNKTGKYQKYEIMQSIALLWKIPVVKAIDNLSTQNIELFVNQVREWDDGEGVVIRFDDGHMVKIKADDYVFRHKSKDEIQNEKNVIQVIIDDSVDDLLPLLCDEDIKRIENFKIAFWQSVEILSNQMNDLYAIGDKLYSDKKEFAINYVQKSVPSTYAPIMYGMKSGKTAKELIIELIKKGISSQPKINQNRWLWGNLEWNNF